MAWWQPHQRGEKTANNFIILQNELRPVGALDGEPLFRSKEEADLYAEMFKGCIGSHPHTVDGEKLYMPCADHSTATMKEETKILLL